MSESVSYVVENFDQECKERKVDDSELPRDPEAGNERRAENARDALRTFVDATGSDAVDAVSDFLCNLMHFSDRYNFDFDSELSRAEMHYHAETGRRA